MFLSNTHKFLFFSVPKTGSTSAMARLCGLLPFVEEQDPRGVDFSTVELAVPRHLRPPLHKHILPEDLAVFLPDMSRYTTAAFVRNPWSWMISWYFFTVRKVERTPGDWAGEQRALETFMEDISARPFMLNNFERYFFDDEGRDRLDFVGRFETLDADFQRFCDQVGLDNPRPLDHRRKGRHNDYRRYYTDTSRAFVAERCARIIERYGYSFDGD